jgi:hypothetical protein
VSSRLNASEQEIILEIVGEIRPEERFLASDYLAASGRRWGFHGSPVDIGLETELNLITPTATMVVIWAYGVIKGEVRSILEDRLKNIVRKMFKIKDPVLPAETPGIPAAQPDLSALRVELTNYGIALGLAPQNATMLADLAVTKASAAIR